jgi:bacteriorhodopsin
MNELSLDQFLIVKDILSFGIACMGAATLFFWLQLSRFSKSYKTAILVTGLVTAIATYHYFRIFNSWEEAFTIKNFKIDTSGIPFDFSYRYVDWLLTVPLLVVELILVMKLSPKESLNKSVKLGSLAALMIIFGYIGEQSQDLFTRNLWWYIGMLPFLVIVYELFKGLNRSLKLQPLAARPLINIARWLIVLTWSFYPIVYHVDLLQISQSSFVVALQVGYTLADILAKAVFGFFIYLIAIKKSGIDA